MITKQAFDNGANEVRNNFSKYMPKMIAYKTYIQKAILDIATPNELNDVRISRINQGMIDKLAKLANREWKLSNDAPSLYCAAMAVATIVKEYDWGTQYLTGDGLWQMANKIQNAN